MGESKAWVIAKSAIKAYTSGSGPLMILQIFVICVTTIVVSSVSGCSKPACYRNRADVEFTRAKLKSSLALLS